jgi:hypothetical protein
MNATPNPERDIRFLELLAELESLGQRDQAIRELASYLGGILKGTSNGQVQLLNTFPLALPNVASDVLPAVGDALPPVHPHVNTLSDNPLASHAMSLLPIEWQVSLHPILSRVAFSMRTLALLLVAALALGIYSGQVTVPAWIREQLQNSTPNCKVQP